MKNSVVAENHSLLITRAQPFMGAVIDMRITQGVITAIAENLPVRESDTVIDAGGNLLLPGLCDHHIHLFATAAAKASVECGPPAVNNPEELAKALQQSPGRGWLRGVGFHTSVCPGLDRHWLDKVCPDRPVRIQQRSGMLWILNSKALEALAITDSDAVPEGVERDAKGALTGCFYNVDAWLGERLQRSWPSLYALSRELMAYGITSVTDTGVNNGLDEWRALAAARHRGELLQKLQVMGNESLLTVKKEASAQQGVGPLKIYLREIDLPVLDVLVERIRASHREGRPVAAHCVTLVELTFMLAALREAGAMPGDRIEHAAITDNAAIAAMHEMGVTAVTQPHFLAERGVQYLQDVEQQDLPLLYRGRGFKKQCVGLAAGSDGPYGGLDPWASMRAAVERCNQRGVVMQGAECLSPEEALLLFMGPLARPGQSFASFAIGQAADLCLLDAPRDVVLRDLSAEHVALTLRDGDICYQREPFIE